MQTTEEGVTQARRFASRAALRCLDLGAALAAMMVLAPLFLVASVMILVEDGRPILFRQQRVGKNGELFDILKFRTMGIRVDGPSITVSGDRRITTAGARLRKYKLDELPQFLNVLRGDMSLIGPRPEVPEFVEHEDQLWRAVLQVRPGITDLASLAFRNEEEMLAPAADPASYYRKSVLPEKLKLNLQYQRSRSLLRDCKLLWMTARYSFYPRGFDRDRIVKSLGE